LAAYTGPDTDYVHQMADAALKAKNRYARIAVPANSETVAERITVHPAGSKLPATFLPQNLQAVTPCMDNAYALRVHCDAWTSDLNRDGNAEVLLLRNNILEAFTEETPGHWVQLGSFVLPSGCQKTLDTLRAGDLQFVDPVAPPMPDLQVADQRFHFAATPVFPPLCKP
jgi:hypothetical protein